MEMHLEALEFIETYLQRTAPFMERVMVFIDGGYWHKCLEDQFKRADAHVNSVVAKLLRGRRLVRTYFYTAKIEKPPDEYWKNQLAEQQKLLTALAHQPFVEVRLGRLQFKEGNVPRQKGVDVLLALDMLRFALKGNYDTAILVSGDGDFADIVRMVKDEGRKVEIVTFPGTRAHALLEASDERTEFTSELLEGCWLEDQD
jgi:uncharacterized LabA/DUF88 family protein